MTTMVTVSLHGRLVIMAGNTGLRSISKHDSTDFHSGIVEICGNFEARTDVADNKNCQDKLSHARNILPKPEVKRKHLRRKIDLRIYGTSGEFSEKLQISVDSNSCEKNFLFPKYLCRKIELEVLQIYRTGKY